MASGEYWGGLGGVGTSREVGRDLVCWPLPCFEEMSLKPQNFLYNWPLRNALM